MAYTTQAIAGYHSTYFVVFTNQEILNDCVKLIEKKSCQILRFLKNVSAKAYGRNYTNLPCLNSKKFEIDDEKDFLIKFSK